MKTLCVISLIFGMFFADALVCYHAHEYYRAAAAKAAEAASANTKEAQLTGIYVKESTAAYKDIQKNLESLNKKVDRLNIGRIGTIGDAGPEEAPPVPEEDKSVVEEVKE